MSLFQLETRLFSDGESGLDRQPSTSLGHVLRLWLSLPLSSQNRLTTFSIGEDRLQSREGTTLSSGRKADPGLSGRAIERTEVREKKGWRFRVPPVLFSDMWLIAPLRRVRPTLSITYFHGVC